MPESADAARLAVLDARIEQLARRLDSGAGAPVDTARLARLASDLDDVKAAASSSIAAVSGLKTGVDNVMGDVSARLNAIENRAGKADASEARAVGLAIAAAELRRTLRSGAPYGSNLAMLRELASGDAALAPHIAILEKSAASGLPTLSALSRRFSNLITDILAAGRERTDATWYEQALERASAIVSIRRIGSDAEGDSADAVIARTEARLADGDLAGVVAQAATLKGAAAVAATPWLADARALLAAEEAVAAINTEALATLAKARGG